MRVPMLYSTKVLLAGVPAGQLGPPIVPGPKVQAPLPYPSRFVPSDETARSSGKVAPVGGIPVNAVSVSGGTATA